MAEPNSSQNDNLIDIASTLESMFEEDPMPGFVVELVGWREWWTS
jgi:hypothetical protein